MISDADIEAAKAFALEAGRNPRTVTRQTIAGWRLRMKRDGALWKLSAEVVAPEATADDVAHVCAIAGHVTAEGALPLLSNGGRAISWTWRADGKPRFRPEPRDPSKHAPVKALPPGWVYRWRDGEGPLGGREFLFDSDGFKVIVTDVEHEGVLHRHVSCSRWDGKRPQPATEEQAAFVREHFLWPGVDGNEGALGSSPIRHWNQFVPKGKGEAS